MDDKLFPKYLKKGSRGPAVAFLQALLLAQDFNPSIIVDGEYGGQTALGVEKLQKFLNNWRGSQLKVDGNFGPATRETYKQYFKLDVDGLPASIFAGTTEVAPA